MPANTVKTKFPDVSFHWCHAALLWAQINVSLVPKLSDGTADELASQLPGSRAASAAPFPFTLDTVCAINSTKTPAGHLGPAFDKDLKADPVCRWIASPHLGPTNKDTWLQSWESWYTCICWRRGEKERLRGPAQGSDLSIISSPESPVTTFGKRRLSSRGRPPFLSVQQRVQLMSQ